MLTLLPTPTHSREQFFFYIFQVRYCYGTLEVRSWYGTGTVQYVNFLLLPTVHESEVSCSHTPHCT